ncbi:MAG: VWA domain-containing protein [Caldilineaceae bacterium]
MTFGAPIYLYALLIVVPAMGLLILWAQQRRRRAMQRLGNPVLVKRLAAGVNWQGRYWKNLLWLISLALLLFALARPQWGEQVQEIERQGVQIMVALDVSQSMLAQDVKPSRLERAKLEISDLMSRLGGDEIGLVLFSGASFIQFPLTSDYNTARTFLDGARPGVISKPGTNIADAVRTAMSGFDDNSTSQRIIVLITDGEAHEAGTVNAVRQAAEEGVVFYTIGFGSPESTHPRLRRAGQSDRRQGRRAGQRGNLAWMRRRCKDRERGQRPIFPRASAGGGELDTLVDSLEQLRRARWAPSWRCAASGASNCF